MIYKIQPVPKPRMLQSDRWRRRPAVLRYWRFCDECRLRKVWVPESGGSITFHLPMPPSWPAKKRALFDGQPHRQKPDLDNLGKSVLDAIYQDDCCVHDLHLSKRWTSEAAGYFTVEVELI